MPTYTLIAGVNGVGKSSFASVLLSQSNDLGIFIDARQIAAQPGSEILGGKSALKQIHRYVQEGISFTQETTLSGRQPLETIQEAREKGFQIRLHYIGLDSLEDSLERIQNRVRRGGHSIPEADVRRRFAKRFDDLLRVLPWCDSAKLYDNYNGFQLVALWQNGMLQPVGTSQPQWLKELERKTGEEAAKR